MLSAVAVCGQRWQIAPDGRGIVWKVGSDIPHDDHIEMSGERMAFVLRWGVDSRGAFRQERSLVFPLLRTLPNNTHASLMYRMAADIPSLLGVDGLALQDERVGQVAIDGALEVRSRWGVGKMNVGSARDMKPEPVVEMTRTIFPSRTLPLMCERYTLRNVGAKPLTVSVPEFSQVVTTDPAKGVTGSYVVRGDIAGSGTFTLAAGDSLAFDAVFQAYPGGGEPLHPDVAAELAARMAFVRECIDANLVLETPDPVIDTQFRYAKLRAAESIVATKGGYMHAPGGESYYAAIWANDQAEYVNPFFPFLGYGVGNASALNSFRHFARFMNPAYEPLPSSVIAEGDDIWNGAGDRGDAAMIACGAARYALARGDRAEAAELWPLVEWCLEYCRRQLTPDGVVASDTDELEGRFPTGDANLCTSTLYYDALLSAVSLGRRAVAARRVVPRILPPPAYARRRRGFRHRRTGGAFPHRRCQPLHLDALLRCTAVGRVARPRAGCGIRPDRPLCRTGQGARPSYRRALRRRGRRVRHLPLLCGQYAAALVDLHAADRGAEGAQRRHRPGVARP